MELFLFERLNNNYEIINNDQNLNNMLNKLSNDLFLLQKQIKDNSSKYQHILKILTAVRKYTKFYFLKSLEIDMNNAYSILSNDFEEKFYLVKLKDYGYDTEFIGKIKNLISSKLKFKTIFYDMLSSDIYEKIKNLDKDDREKYIYKNKLQTILYIFDILEKNGELFLTFHGFCNYKYILDIYYILIYMFDYCVIYGDKIIAKKFNPVLSKNDMEKIINNNFIINPLFDTKIIVNNIQNNILYEIQLHKFILENNSDKFFSFFINEAVLHLHMYHPDLTKIKFKDFILKNMKSDYLKIYKINNSFGSFISTFIEEYSIFNCLQIGFGLGISASQILSNENVKLLSIDPYQKTKWKSYGLDLLKDLNLIDRHKLIIKKSSMALPLLANKKYDTFDLIFIDENILLHHLLNDLFYSNILLKNNGFILISNTNHQSVIDTVQFIDNNYKNYKKINFLDSHNSFVVFQKINEDNRERIITFNDNYVGSQLTNTMSLISKYNITTDILDIPTDFDWLIKQKKGEFYRQKFEHKSWKKTAFDILTNPDYKPNIQKLNKAIEYFGDFGSINTLDSEFPEQILCEKYILEHDCVLEIGSRYASVSNIINIKLKIKTNQVSVDADLSIKKYHELNKKQYINNFIPEKDKKYTYHSYFGMIDDSDTDFYLKKMDDTYGNNVVPFHSLNDDDVIIGEKKHKLFSTVKSNFKKLNKYKLDKIKYKDIQSTFNLTKPINVLVLDCEGCGLVIINQIIKANMLNDLEIILIELDMDNLCNYSDFDKILTDNGFKLHVCIWYNAVYLRTSRLNKYYEINKNYFSDEWWDGLIEIDRSIQISKKYNKKK